MKSGKSSLATLVLFLACVMGVPDAAEAKTQAYKVDSVHSSIMFRVKHMDVSYFYGRFNQFEGTIDFDADDPTKIAIHIEIKTATVDTNNENRNNHLKGPDFFNARQFPVISFTSKSVKRVKDDIYELTGEMNLHGVKKEITLTLEKTGEGARRGKPIIGFETVFTINRTDFGMDKLLQGVSDEVRLIIGLQAGQQDASASKRPSSKKDAAVG